MEKKSDENLTFIEPLIERLEEHGKTSYQLLRLKTIFKTTEFFSIVASRGLVILIFLMFILILSMGLSFWLGNIFGRLEYGFFCVAILYAITGLILHFFLHKRIKKQMSNMMISYLLN